MSDKTLLRVEELTKTFGGKKSPVRAVDRVSFSIEKGKTLGIVGESGSGKTTTGRLILHLLSPDSGKVLYAGNEVSMQNIASFRQRMQIIFQNPGGSLDPRLPVGDVVAEGIRANHLIGSKREIHDQVGELLHSVGLKPEDSRRYPSEFSGGQQQRIGIARALAVNPEFIVCDEPVSALDVSYQSQIINLLEDMQAERQLTYLFISHDLSVVMHISDEIGVMFSGRLVELGPAEEVILHPAHPYTRTLLAAIPIPDPKLAKARTRVTVPTGEAPTAGCAFAHRCSQARERCRYAVPPMQTVAPGHSCACFLTQ